MISIFGEMSFFVFVYCYYFLFGFVLLSLKKHTYRKCSYKFHYEYFFLSLNPIESKVIIELALKWPRYIFFKNFGPFKCNFTPKYFKPQKNFRISIDNRNPSELQNSFWLYVCNLRQCFIDFYDLFDCNSVWFVNFSFACMHLCKSIS